MVKKIKGLYFRDHVKHAPSLGAQLLCGVDLGDYFKKCAEEDGIKLITLMRHYDVKPSEAMFYELCLALARELYPEPRPRGRKSKWTLLNKGALVVEVERLVNPDDPLRGVAWACGVLASREPWKSFLETKEGGSFGPNPAEALRQTYFSFRGEKWAMAMRHSFKYHEHEGDLAKWDEDVFDYVRKPFLD